MKKLKPDPTPKPNQPVKVRLMYTGWNVVERWLTFPNLKTYQEKMFSRYLPFQERHTIPRLRRRFKIMEVTWDGKK